MPRRWWLPKPWPGWRDEPDVDTTLEEDFRNWCITHGYDPESLDGILAYEEFFTAWLER